MALTGNPRKHARDVADGYVLLTPILLRGAGVGDLGALKLALELHLRDVRGERITPDDLVATQLRQRRILRLHQALRVLRTYCLKRRLPV